MPVSLSDTLKALRVDKLLIDALGETYYTGVKEIAYILNILLPVILYFRCIPKSRFVIKRIIRMNINIVNI